VSESFVIAVVVCAAVPLVLLPEVLEVAVALLSAADVVVV
jgi:hypothetical protein